MKAKFAQACRYCDEPAMLSLRYGKAEEYMSACYGHEGVARHEIKKMGRGVTDCIAVDNTGVASVESRMARALEPAPSYPAATAESRFGLRVDARRAAAAVSEAEVSPASAATPIKRISEPGKDLPAAFLQALGTDWRNLRAIRVHSNRITVSIDDQKYTVYTRRG